MLLTNSVFGIVCGWYIYIETDRARERERERERERKQNWERGGWVV